MDLNKATAEELESAFQVDGTRARYIIERREQIGGFSDWEEVKQVPGFEDKMVENLQSAGLTIGSKQGSEHRGQRRQEERPPEHRTEAGQRGQEERRAEQRPAVRAAGAGESHTTGGIDVNSASAEELRGVFQIDGERAQYLIDARKRLGGFESWEQIKSEVPSFEDGMIENMKEAGARIGPKH